MPAFARTIGIDYSGAETPTASLKGLRVYLAEGDGHPVEVQPPQSPRKYWTRKGIAEWLVERLPFLNAYRTMCMAPDAALRDLLEQVAADHGRCDGRQRAS